MTASQPQYYNYSSNQPRRRTLQEYFSEHRLLALILAIFSAVLAVTVAIIIIMATTPKEIPQEIEDPPYITFENQGAVYNNPFVGDTLMFYLDLILLNTDELNSAPTDNNHDSNHVVTFDDASYTTTTASDTMDIYSIKLKVSDGRQYTLHYLVNIEYDNEYAVAALDRTDLPNGHDYIITLTSNTSSYYMSLGTGETQNNSGDTSQITDYITGNPLTPLPEKGIAWVDSLQLTAPQTLHTTLPSIR